jgi:hypothetical protein
MLLVPCSRRMALERGADHPAAFLLAKAPCVMTALVVGVPEAVNLRANA